MVQVLSRHVLSARFWRGSALTHHEKTLGSPMFKMAKKRKRASQAAKPTNKVEKEFRKDGFNKTLMDIRVPTNPKVDTKVKTTPSTTYSNVRNMLSKRENKKSNFNFLFRFVFFIFFSFFTHFIYHWLNKRRSLERGSQVAVQHWKLLRFPSSESL